FAPSENGFAYQYTIKNLVIRKEADYKKDNIIKYTKKEEVFIKLNEFFEYDEVKLGDTKYFRPVDNCLALPKNLFDEEIVVNYLKNDIVINADTFILNKSLIEVDQIYRTVSDQRTKKMIIEDDKINEIEIDGAKLNLGKKS